MDEDLLSQEELADRWKLQISTLSQWRWNGQGPYFIKINGKIKYKVSDIESFERSKRCRSTSEYHANKLGYYNTPTPLHAPGKEFKLHLMSELPKDGRPLTGKLYIEASGNALKYKALDHNDAVVEGMLDIQVRKALTAETLRVLKPRILAEMSKKGHAFS